MKFVYLILLFLFFVSCQKETKETTDPPLSKWELIWSDEFEYTGSPNPAYWSYETGFMRNNEAQYYTDNRAENCRVEDGCLLITALNDTFEGHPITSASIQTKGKIDFKYGRLEIRAKMPHSGGGTWPAIWTLGANSSEVGWPYCGEIDIMEWIGNAPTVILGSIYAQAAESTSYKERHWPYLVSNAAMLSDTFHNYAIEWDSTRIKFYFDDINYVTYTKADLGRDWAPFTQEQYLKLNLAMGGFIPPIGGGGTIDYTRFPYTFEIDYARYYKLRE